MKTSTYKNFYLFTIVIFVFLLIQPFAWAQKNSTIKDKNIKKPALQQRVPDTKDLKKGKRSPDAQVVNNSGENIYQVKVGNMIFSRHIGSCSDGCSTGFKKVNTGSNSISIKTTAISPWIVIGTLNGFENNKHYAVNLVKGPKDNQACAELFLRHNTSPTFNNDRTKQKIGKTCKILPDNTAKRVPDTQVVNNSGIAIHQVKVGNVFFSEHIGSCTDGCSTSFKKIKTGTNTIAVQIRPGSPWVDIGTLSGFMNNKHYAVNFVPGRGGVMCAELYLRRDTHFYFNDGHTKEIKDNVCSRFIPLVPVD